MKPRTTRKLGVLLVVLAIAGLAAAMPTMLGRLENRSVPMVWFGEATDATSFPLLGDDVSIETVGVSKDSEDVEAVTRIRVAWKGIEHEVEIQQREDERLPGLLRYGNWIQVVPMAVPPAGEAGGLPRLMELMESGAVQPELLVAVRQLPEGFDPETWGAARRKAWNYKFVVFSTDGAGNATSRVVERNYGEMQDLTEALFTSLDYERASALKGGPERLVDEMEKVREKYPMREQDASLWAAVDALAAGSGSVSALRGELEERFWQYQAMLLVTPKLQHPRTKVVDYGISSMGWTWPVAGASALLMTVGIFLVMSSFVRRDEALPLTG